MKIKRHCQNFWTHGLREKERVRDKWRDGRLPASCFDGDGGNAAAQPFALCFLQTANGGSLIGFLMALALKRARIQALSPPLSLSLALTALDRTTSQIPKASEAYLKIHVILAWPS